jgi:hypothetical protein
LRQPDKDRPYDPRGGGGLGFYPEWNFVKTGDGLFFLKMVNYILK